MVKRLLVLVVSLVLGLVIAACAAPAPTATSTTAPSKAAQPTAAPTKAAAEARPTVPPNQKELNILVLGGQQEKMIRRVVEGFEKQYGVKVNMTGLNTPEITSRVLAQKDRPELDFVINNDQNLLLYKQEGLIAKFDPRRVPNAAKLPDQFKDPDGVAVPQGIGLIVIAYNAKVFQDKGFAPPTSIFDLWRPELKGHVVVQNISNVTMYGWLPIIAKSLTGDEKNVNAFFAKMKELVPNILTFAVSAQTDDLFKTGDLWIAVHNQLRVVGLKDQGFPIEYVVPKEGAVPFTNWLIALKGAPHPELRDELMNYFLTPPAQRIMAEDLGYPPLISGVELTPDVTKKLPKPEEVNKAVKLDAKWINDNVASWTERWNKEIEVR